MDKKVFHTKKSTSLLFFPHSKKRKKKKERKKNVHRAAAAARFFSAQRQPLVRRQHPVVDHRRGVTSAVRGRDERRDPNRACLRGRLLSLRCSFFFIPRVVSLFWRTQSALCRKERRHDGDQNRDCADSFDDKKNDDDGFAHPIVAEGSTRRHVAGPPSLSLSTGDDDVNDESPKSEEKDGTSRVVVGFCTTGGETKRDHRGASFRLRRR